MHRILERYEKERETDEAFEYKLHRIAQEVFADVAVGYSGDPLLLHIERDRLSAGLIDDNPGGPLKAWLDLETSHKQWRTPIAAEQSFEGIPLGPITLRGAMDRMDHLPNLGGHLVIDFKTGAVPSTALVKRGLAFQPVAYLQASAQMRPGEPGVAVYMGVGKAGAVSFNTWVGDGSLIDALVPKRKRRSTLALSQAERDTHLQYAAEAMERMKRGVFHTTFATPEEAGCTSCDLQRTCRINPLRNQRISLSPGDYQAPMGGQDT